MQPNWKRCVQLWFLGMPVGAALLNAGVYGEDLLGPTLRPVWMGMLLCGVVLIAAPFVFTVATIVISIVRAIVPPPPPPPPPRLMAGLYLVPSLVPAQMPCHCGETITIPAEGDENWCVRCGCGVVHNVSGVGYRPCAMAVRSELLDRWTARAPEVFDTEELAFLKQIVATPADHTARLAYADWLDEQGDPRGEYVRVECELAALDAGDERAGELRMRSASLRGELALDPLWTELLSLVGAV